MESESASDDSSRFDDAEESANAPDDYWRRTLLLMAQLHPTSVLLQDRQGSQDASVSKQDASTSSCTSSSDPRVQSSEDASVFDALRVESPEQAMQRDCDAWLARRHRAFGQMLRRFDQGFPDPRWLAALRDEVRRLPRDIDFERRVRKLEAVYGLCLVYGVCGLAPASLRRAQDGLVRGAMHEIDEVLATFESACIRLRPACFRLEIEKLRNAALERLCTWAERRRRLIRAPSDRQAQLQSLLRTRAMLASYLPALPPDSEASSSSD